MQSINNYIHALGIDRGSQCNQINDSQPEPGFTVWSSVYTTSTHQHAQQVSKLPSGHSTVI